MLGYPGASIQWFHINLQYSFSNRTVLIYMDVPEQLCVRQGWAKVLMLMYVFSYESWHNLPLQNFFHTDHIHRAYVLCVSSGAALIHLLGGILCCTGHIGNYWLLYVCLHEPPDDSFAWSSCHSAYTCKDALQCGSSGALLVSYLTSTSCHRSHSQRSFPYHALPEN